MASTPTSLRHAPSVTVVFELEAKPKVIVDATTDGDLARLRSWLDHNPALFELVVAAERFERRAA